MLKLKKITCCALVLSGLLLACCFAFFKSPTFFIEHARTEEQIQWGLMQRRFLPENSGMLFHYSQPQKLNFWSFNCYIDLSVAFIDEKGVVREIKTLKAFPEKMDPSRPVLSNRDFALYSYKDPIVIFFQKNSISASVPVKYVLEMNLGWFERNKVQVGDILHWNDNDSSAFFTSPN
ncbi:MAG: DUF192 domain-containing protein [Rhabdochlamydiaceae bacterium]|nr:DUF192 domain-containing protein [Rhabdochlamydiaceae bacterium]